MTGFSKKLSNLVSDSNIDKIIDTGKPIDIDLHICTDEDKNHLFLLLSKVLEKYGKIDLVEAIHSSLIELVINGVKANMKHYYFNAAKIDPKSEESLRKGYKLLKEKLNIIELKKFKPIAKKEMLKIHISIIHSIKKLLIFVENNTPLTNFEDRRIREKFGKALAYDSIADFYMDAGDDIEGSGLGITMIVLMLKGQDIDPHAFTINTSNQKTTLARIEFPLKGQSISRYNEKKN
jgi:hypothetical protein